MKKTKKPEKGFFIEYFLIIITEIKDEV